MLFPLLASIILHKEHTQIWVGRAGERRTGRRTPEEDQIGAAGPGGWERNGGEERRMG